MAVLVVINPDSTRADLLVCLNNYTAEASLLSCRGFVGNRIDRYTDLHDTMNALITAMETMSILGELERSI